MSAIPLRHHVAASVDTIVDVVYYRHMSRREAERRSQPSSRQLNLVAIGKRVQTERQRRDLSLVDLQERSGVSRSMISAVERGAKAATVLVLDRIATGLGTSLARLLASGTRSRVIVLPQKRQSVARDPAGWERRILSPVLPGVEFELMRTTLGPHVDAGTFLPHATGSREYVAIETGTLVLTLDGHPYRLSAGDSIYYEGDCLHAFANPGRVPCTYYLAMDVSGDPAGTHHETAPVVDARSGQPVRASRPKP